MNAPTSKIARIRLAWRTRQKDSANPFSAPNITPMTTAGRVIATEFQKFTLKPVQARPVHVPYHAVLQALKSNAPGKANIFPARISSMLLSDVVTTI
jgi:hypothetical protein